MPARASPLAEPTPGPQRLDQSRFDPAKRRRLSPPALRTFLAIADLWGLAEEQRRLVLGYPSRSTYHSWCRRARAHGTVTLDVDVLTRISALLGIHQALGILFPDEHAGVAWLRGPHEGLPFGGLAPIDLVASGSQDALLTVRRFLDAGGPGILYDSLRRRDGTNVVAHRPRNITEILQTDHYEILVATASRRIVVRRLAAEE